MAKGAVKEREQQPDDDAVDNVHEMDDLRTGPVSEARLEVQREVARQLGWTPQEEWKRDPAKWVDADKFLENTPREIARLKDERDRAAQAAEAVLESERRAAREQALAEYAAAVKAEDPDREAAARQRIVSEPPREVGDWIRQNPWYMADPAAQAVATAVSQRLANRPIAEQLRAAEEEVRRRFPEHFDAPEPQREEVRLSEARRAPPPPVQGGGRTNGSAQVREKGWGDIPPSVRQSVTSFIKTFQRRGLTEAQAQERYAKSYWSEQA